MLVSVAVISYNSEKTIIETLNSILNQRYGSKNIELVISDDCSTDNTKILIEEWISRHKYRFYNIKFICQNINVGISANCNSAWYACECDWIKTIAADDLLLINCIEDNILYIKENPSVKVLFSYMLAFNTADGKVLARYPLEYKLNFFNLSAELQFRYLLKYSFNFAPSSFINRKELISIGYADEQFKLIEDLPLWLKFTSASIPLRFLPTETVKYRCGESLTSSNTKFTNLNFDLQLLTIYETLIFPNLSKKEILFQYDKRFEIKSRLYISKLTNNKKNILSMSIYRIVNLLRPFWYINQLQKTNFN